MIVMKTKSKKHRKCLIKRKLKFKDYKYCLEETHLEKIKKHLEQNKLDVVSLQ